MEPTLKYHPLMFDVLTLVLMQIDVSGDSCWWLFLIVHLSIFSVLIGEFFALLCEHRVTPCSLGM